MERYSGPMKAGMRFERMDAAGIRHEITGDHGASVEDIRRFWRPVRPADGDTAAWALFLPDAPLPDTGPKVAKAGEVWAWSSPIEMRSSVIEIGGEGDYGNSFVLAGHASVRDHVTGSELITFGSDRIKHAVLLFDAPEVNVTTPAQAAIASTPTREVVRKMTAREVREGEFRNWEKSLPGYAPDPTEYRWNPVMDDAPRARCSTAPSTNHNVDLSAAMIETFGSPCGSCGKLAIVDTSNRCSSCAAGNFLAKFKLGTNPTPVHNETSPCVGCGKVRFMTTGQRCGACVSGPPMSGLPAVASAGSRVSSVPMTGQVTFAAGTEIKAGQTVSVTPSGAVLPAQREPVAPWVRLETPGTYRTNPWRCNVSPGHARERVSARYSRGWGGVGEASCNGACEDCAEAAGVFGPVAAYQSASSSGYAAGGISVGSVSGTPWSPSIGAPIVSGSIGTGTKIVLPSLGMPKPAFLDMPPVVTKPSTAPVTKPVSPPWKCHGRGVVTCKTPDAPPSMRPQGFLGPPAGYRCTVCDDQCVAEKMQEDGDSARMETSSDADHVPGIHPSYLPDPSVYASPFRKRDRSDVEVRVDLDELP